MGVSVWEAITFLPALSWVLGRGFLAMVFGPLRWGRTRTKPYGVYVQQRIFNTMFATMTARQLQVILPPWVKTYTAEMKKAKKPIEIEKIPNTTIEGVWFGDKNKAQTIMIYIHGGGFAMPGFDMHATMLIRVVDWFDGKLAIFAPAYTLTPYAAYPQALGECVEATRFVLEGIGKNKDVIVSGDSAGGQLLVALLSHVSGHQHPESNIVRPLDLQGKKFKGALALAPWVSSDTKKFPSTHTQSYTDVIGPPAATYWSALYKNGREDDNYIVAEMAPATWWSDLSRSVDDLLVLCGNDETLRDPIKSWFEHVQQGWRGGKARIVVADGESHDEPLNKKDQKMVKTEVLGQEKTQEGAMYTWLKEKLA